MASASKSVTASNGTPKPRRRGRPRAGDDDVAARDRILEAAATAFTENGFNGVSVPDIARLAGVTHPLVHYHFKTKEALWQSVVDHLFRDVPTVLLGTEEERAAETNAELRFMGMARRIVVHAALNPALPRFVIHEGMFRGPRCDWLIQKHLHSLFSAFMTAYREAAAAGNYKEIPEVSLLNIFNGATFLIFSSAPLVEGLHGTNVLDEEFARNHAEQVLTVVLDGLRNKD